MEKKDKFNYLQILQASKKIYIEDIEKNKKTINRLKDDLKWFEDMDEKYGSFNYSALSSKCQCYIDSKIEDIVYNSIKLALKEHSNEPNKSIEKLDLFAQIESKQEETEDGKKYIFYITFFENNKKVISHNITSIEIKNNSITEQFFKEINVYILNLIARYTESYYYRHTRRDDLKIEIKSFSI